MKETNVKRLSNGIHNVNGKYYLCTFLEEDKYGENRFVFQKFDIKGFKKSKKKKVNDFVAKFKLTVIDDSTYTIKKVEID